MRRSWACTSCCEPALPGEHERDLGTRMRACLLRKRGEPVGAVVACVLLVADPDQRRLQELDDGGEHLVRGMPGGPRSVSIRCRIAGKHAANAGRRSNFTRSRNSVQSGWYRYCSRPRSSRPTAWRCESGSSLMRTSVHAGGITMPRMRSSVVGSVTLEPSTRGS